MKIYQILLLCGVIISSVTTSFYLVKMFSLLWKNRDIQSISDKELDNNLKYMVISIVLSADYDCCFREFSFHS